MFLLEVRTETIFSIEYDAQIGFALKSVNTIPLLLANKNWGFFNV
jgi:hypothetical protein